MPGQRVRLGDRTVIGRHRNAVSLIRPQRRVFRRGDAKERFRRSSPAEFAVKRFILQQFTTPTDSNVARKVRALSNAREEHR